MVDANNPKDPKDLNQQVPPDPQARPDKDQLTDEDLDKISGGDLHIRPNPLS
jgi:hypothetical protein